METCGGENIQGVKAMDSCDSLWQLARERRRSQALEFADGPFIDNISGV